MRKKVGLDRLIREGVEHLFADAGKRAVVEGQNDVLVPELQRLP